MTPAPLLLEVIAGCAALLACAGWLAAARLHRRLQRKAPPVMPPQVTLPDTTPHGAERQQSIIHEQESTLLADSIPGMALILGPMGQILACNARTHSHYGDSLPALLRHPATRHALHEAFHAPAAEDGLPVIAAVTVNLDVPVRQSIRLAMRQITGTGRRDRRVLALLDDHSTIEATERMRADFLAHASHELRTPLASLSGFIELLRENEGSTADERALYLGIMHQQATRMQRLIDRLLYLSQLQLRGHARPCTRLDVEELFAIVTGEVTPRFHQPGRVLDVTCEAGLTVLADEDEMVQVFLNLVENAIRHASQPGRALHIRLSARQAGPEDNPASTGEGILLAVEDNGPGIAARHLPRLTERFYRVEDKAGDSQMAGMEASSTADDTADDTGAGAGLGLSIVRQILERHNGQLRFASTPGQGTACRIWLPAASPSATPAA